MQPDTSYEARFVMSDPDGVAGHSGTTATKTVTVRTRRNRSRSQAGVCFMFIRRDYKGTKIEPAFDALMCAYNYYCGGGDTVTAAGRA